MQDYLMTKRILIRIIKILYISQMKSFFLKFSKQLNKKNSKEITEWSPNNNKSKKSLQVATSDK